MGKLSARLQTRYTFSNFRPETGTSQGSNDLLETRTVTTRRNLSSIILEYYCVFSSNR
uniref:Uncharacterized protein n=1 Tax=Arion vulgaris TaxID=1028688 RepID=A0A0B6ZZW7_9EUPU